MGKERKDVKCPWCGETVPIAEVKVSRNKNDYANVVERKCGKCNKVLAAYADDLGEFLTNIRTF